MPSPPPLVDFHCHLDLYPDFASAVRECDVARVRTLAVTTTPRAWPHNVEQIRGSKYVRPALGFHPQLVGTKEASMKLFERYLPEARYVGEIGLDAGPAFYKTFEEQKRAFERVLRLCVEQTGKILTIHSVRSVRAVLDLLEATGSPTKTTVVLHWFTGSAAELRRAVELNCHFSVNNTMLSTDRSKSLVQQMPLERILTETDGPFTKVDRRVSKPADVELAVTLLAELRGLSPAEARARVGENLAQLVSGKPALKLTLNHAAAGLREPRDP